MFINDGPSKYFVLRTIEVDYFQANREKLLKKYKNDIKLIDYHGQPKGAIVQQTYDAEFKDIINETSIEAPQSNPQEATSQSN